MLRIILLALVSLLASSLHSEAGRTEPVVISIDRNENTYLYNVLISDVTQLAQMHASAIYLRVDRDTRAQAMCRVLTALPNGAGSFIFLGQPQSFGKRIPLTPNKAVEELGSIPVMIKITGNSWTSETTSTIFLVDFDGTVTSSRTPRGLDLTRELLDENLAKLATQLPHSHIYISGNHLSKVDTIETVAAIAKRRGFNDITIVCGVS